MGLRFSTACLKRKRDHLRVLKILISILDIPAGTFRPSMELTKTKERQVRNVIIFLDLLFLAFSDLMLTYSLCSRSDDCGVVGVKIN